MVHPDFQERNNDLDIAVIGMACRFPGAQNIGEFWKNLANGVESIKFFTDQELIAEGVDPEVLRDPNYVKAASIIEGVDEFDASFFGYSAKEAKMMDPQHRLFLETSWEALGTAGYPPRGDKRSIGVFAGESMSTYRLYNLHGLLDDRDFILSQKNIGAVIGNNSDFLATRVSYKLNLRGPSVNVQTACSTSLVAVHTAYQSLLNGECDMALAGGVSIYLPQKAGYFYQEGMILSRDGHCRTFDADATGTIFGRGVGVVVLKRLADALADHDNIRAVIIGSAINNDGAQKVGFTAPSVDGQAEVIAEALAVAGIEAETINYIETHGTGTPKGDPIEIEALTQVYRLSTSRKGFCAIGSVKSNIGHLDAASAAASLIKTVLALENRQVPPSLHFKKPNPEINFGESPFYVNTSLKEWGRNLNPRRAGVSSFGIGGTNVHLILEEAPPSQVAKKANERPHQVLALSAVNEAALGDLAARYASYLEDHRTEDIGDICYTANSGRTHFDHRLAIRGNSTLQLQEKLSAFRNGQSLPGIKSGRRQYEPGQNVAFLFPGQGSQYVGMGQQLYETQPSFREIINQCDDLMRQYLGVSLLSVLYPEDEASSQIHETIYTQPAIFAIEYALAKLWQSWGIEPSVVLGHSLGEYAAACVAGVFSLEDGFKLVAERGRLMLSLPDNGAMVVVFAPEDDVANAITKYSDTLSIAAINGSVNTVVSGTTGSMDLLIGEFETLGIRTQRLNISRPAHSPYVDPMLDAFEDAAQRITYQEPQIDMVSGFTGKIVEASQINNARYWRRNIREAVLFSDAMNTLIENSCKIFIETGPAPTLLSMGRKCVPKDAGLWLPSLRPKREDWQQMLDSLGELYAYGIEVDWGGFDKDYERHRVVLPTYPFQRKSYWIHADRKKAVNTGGISEGYEEPSVHPLLNRRLISPSLKDIVFESKISSNAPAFIKDHQIQGSVVFPAAAIIEMILSAGNLTNGDWAQSIEDLAIQHAMVFKGDDPLTIQLIQQEAGDGNAFIKLFSYDPDNKGDQWTLHATGRLNQLTDRHIQVDHQFQNIRKRFDEEVDTDTYYRKLRDMGLGYGAYFQGIQKLWKLDGEALAYIQPMVSSSKENEDYSFHPAILDACLHTLLITLTDIETNDQPGVIYLPIGIQRFRLHKRAFSPLWSYAHLDPGQDTHAEVLSANISIFDDVGQLVAEITGLRIRRVSLDALPWAADKPWADWLYEITWSEQPLSEPEVIDSQSINLPAPIDIEAYLQPLVGQLGTQYNLDAYKSLQDQLNALSAAFIVSALQDIGWDMRLGQRFSTKSLERELGIAPQHHRLLGRMLTILKEDGFLCKSDPGWEVCRLPEQVDLNEQLSVLAQEHAASSSLVKLFREFSQHLAQLLRGEKDPLQLLFPEGSLETAEELYSASPFARFYNSLIQEVISFIVGQTTKSSKIRILEIGAGTGGTTSRLLPELPPERASYDFTDVSHLFLSKARDKYAHYPFVQYKILDIEKDPEAQGFASDGYDLILASNVLHATRDLHETLEHVKKLLAPGGILTLIEGTGPQSWADLIFGFTDGWWRFDDADLRPSYPLLDQTQWLSLLEKMGFNHPMALPDISAGEGDAWQTVIVAQNKEAESPIQSEALESPLDRESGQWIIFVDGDSVGSSLADLISAHGGNCLLVSAGESREIHQDGYVRINPDEPEDYLWLLSNTRAGDKLPIKGIVYLWGLNGSTPEKISAPGLLAEIKFSNSSLLYLAQALVKSNIEETPRLYLVTRGSQSVENERLTGLSQSTIWGLGKAIAMEHPELNCVRKDLAPIKSKNEVQRLFTDIWSGDTEDQVSYRNGHRYTPQLIRVNHEDRLSTSLESETPARLNIISRGTLENLTLQPITHAAPGRDEVQIRVYATGLNFKDVLNALGMYPGDPGPLGGECAGIITVVGDDVVGLNIGDPVIAVAFGSFSTFANTKAELVVPKPDHLSYEQAATIPVAFLTAYYALHNLANIKAGESILIHSAAGGVGMAAVQIAQRIGAEVFATAGNPQKRAILHSMGVRHVMDSRTLNFADQILTDTNNHGVDIVLNSLSGEFIPKSIASLCSDGRFIEIGKRDIWDDEAISNVKPDATYFHFDLGEIILETPEIIRAILLKIMNAIEDGSLKPLPHRAFTIQDAKNAFRFMANAKHIGKIVITQQRPILPLRGDGVYLITGGLGGLGLLFARWLVDHGARSLMLMGRSGATPDGIQTIQELTELGATVEIMKGDVSSEADVARVLVEIEKKDLPLFGIIHAAGVLDDGVLLQQSWERFEKVYAPKVAGSWNLHLQTKHLPLDFFILFSSGASMIGSLGQANHVAACTFEDALAHYRRAEGLPALSINWGPWAEVGAVIDRNVLERLAAQGMDPIAPSQGLDIFEHLLPGMQTQVGAIPIDWDQFIQQSWGGRYVPLFSELNVQRSDGKDKTTRSDTITLAERIARAPTTRRRNLMVAFVREQLGISLGLEPTQHVDQTQPLSQLGLDSLMAIELRNLLGAGLGLDRTLPATLLFDYPTIGALTNYLTEEIIGSELPEEIPPTSQASAAGASYEDSGFEDLSDEEISDSLQKELELLPPEYLEGE